MNVGTGIILREKNSQKELLLLQRISSAKNYPNAWTFPSGKQEGNETPEQTAVREVQEECGLTFEPTEILRKERLEGRLCHRFLGNWTGEVTIQKEEVQDYGWFTYEQTKELELAFNYRDIIELLHKKNLL